ncbi:ATPase [Novosphingobium profundi]|uniref:ATPase n=1 Tax=Novosphingobium profundi TaxID=1774954 RepID=UPI001BD9C5E0|nr:ATPase [Novosphingobium profundi]MBT0669736.1 ATPase [Novosphingobium profundi]
MSGDSRIISFGGTPAEDATNAHGTNAQGTEETRLRDALSTNGEKDAESEGDWDMAWVSGNASAEPEWDPDASRAWLVPMLAGITALGWSGLFVASQWPALKAGIAFSDVPALVTQWCVPLLLVGLVWLLALRHSAREGKRFGDVARTLSHESANLEQRLVSVNRELSLAREFVAAQARDLESLGRLATERLSTNAQRLQELVLENNGRVETIASVSSTALDNMERLRGQLPVIASSAKDVTSNIANAGRMAHGQLEEMISGFHRLNEFGQANERQIASVRTSVDAALAQFAGQCEDLEVLARKRFAALAEQGEQFRTELERHEVQALASIRTRANALQGEINQTREQLDENEASSLTSLRARLSALREECGVVARSIAEAQQIAGNEVRANFAALRDEQQGAQAELSAAHDNAMAQLGQRASALRSDIGSTEERISASQDAALRLLGERLSAISAQAEDVDARLRERDAQFASTAQERQTRQVEQERHALARIEHMLGELDAAIAERLERHRHQADGLSERARAVTAELEHFDARLRSIATQSGDTENRLATSLRALSDNLASSRASLASADTDVAKLTEDSLRLLDLLRAGSHLAHGELPEAISVSEDRLIRLDAGINEVRAKLEDAAVNGYALSGSLETSSASLAGLNDQLTSTQHAITQRGEEHAEHFARLRATLQDIESALLQNSDRAQGELSTAVQTLRSSLDEAICAIETDAPARVDAVSQSLGDTSGKAIDKAMRTTVAEISGQLEQAVAHASGVSREATVQLREQMEKVTELVANLETRLDEARERASEQVNNDFARRAALITESLNSNAIDIAAALSSEVSDTAWASYLRGDRGIFTRRAVNLIDASDAKAIHQTFERDDAFREHVSRYIHDFESLLRQVLSTRDGNAMGVTLLSSDMGKLYVALAQGIERLRN